jgi:hypothetical protein
MRVGSLSFSALVLHKLCVNDCLPAAFSVSHSYAPPLNTTPSSQLFILNNTTSINNINNLIIIFVRTIIFIIFIIPASFPNYTASPFLFSLASCYGSLSPPAAEDTVLAAEVDIFSL